MKFIDALGIVFITLKLCTIIDWSWWFVLIPVYGPIIVKTILSAIEKTYGRNK